ncbi:CHASE sensor domain-containing protein [Coraliomargarita algicola]|uniref:CHASE sensor domain-containing protein n=1 Tax=Coraliomargarita algicola TaxID=3092156 RepID=A0ABZ0RSN7_9BACT|nr:CHASE sensor domain-containing protein [Coraliomargarita sp. J2-16]WPJ98078.1 CHASE sensor domain-containing protein [Coraliomargarita sp. J2-16]
MKSIFNITFLKNLPIAKKIGLVTLLTSTVTLFILSSAYFIFNWSQYKGQQLARLESIAGITASATEAALMFDDKQAANEYLSWLRHEQGLEMAILFDAQNDLFASFQRAALAQQSQAPNWQTLNSQFSDSGYLKPIYSDSIKLGTIFLQSNQSMLKQVLRS